MASLISGLEAGGQLHLTADIDFSSPSFSLADRCRLFGNMDHYTYLPLPHFIMSSMTGTTSFVSSALFCH